MAQVGHDEVVAVGEASLTGQIPGPGVDVRAVRALAGDLRGLASTVAGGPVIGVGGWQGEAALAYATWAARLLDALETAASIAVIAAAELRDVADAGEAAASEIGRLHSEVALTAADPATLLCAVEQATGVTRRQEAVEQRAASRLMDLAGQVPGAPVGVCRSGPVADGRWTMQQSRDLLRGVGDAAWDVGPGGVSAFLRWATVPGWLNAYDALDRRENEGKASLDEWGGGRTDTATNRAAYATTAVLTALIPVPAGKATVAARATRATPAFPAAPAHAAWVGRGGEWLSEADLRTVDEFHAAAVAAEPRMTAIMDDVMVGLPTVAAAGRQYVLKSPDSLRRKVATSLLSTRTGGAAGAVLSAVTDATRYTFVVNGDTFVEQVNVVTSRLVAADLKPVRWSSKWEGDGYRGVNSSWRAPGGQIVEVQFHTPVSLWAKEFTHGWYEKMRLPNVSASEVVTYQRLQNEVFETVPVPLDLRSLIGPKEARP